MAPLTVGSLFAGIGGFDLAAERVGFKVRWQVEIDEYCNRVLEKHWPHVQRFRDIRDAHELELVDIICGGFPCQDISEAGRGAGIDGSRSGLWRQFARLVRQLRPSYVIVENAPILNRRGLDRVLGDLAECGFDAEWEVLSASRFGAPHTRRRLIVVAYAAGQRQLECGWFQFAPNLREEGDVSYWARESTPARVVDGVPNRSHRLRLVGNSVSPQVAEWIFRRIKEAERRDEGAADEARVLTKGGNS